MLTDLLCVNAFNLVTGCKKEKNMENGVWIILSLYGVGVFLWIMVFRHIKYIFSLYGGKYIIFLFAAAIASSFFIEESVGVSVLMYLCLTFVLWFSIFLFKGIAAIVRSEAFQRGRRNYNNLGALNENWAPKSNGRQMIGGAKPPAKGKNKQRKVAAVSNNSASNAVRSKERDGSKASAKKAKQDKKVTPFGSSMKLCATCSKWGGQREIGPGRAGVSTDGIAARGQCIGGGHNHADTPPTARCDEWEKWTALR